jgi:hypothetical protein
LKNVAISEKDLPAGDRIVDRIERYLQKKKINLRPSGGFNHYTVAANFARESGTKIDEDTLRRFEALFDAVNSLF